MDAQSPLSRRSSIYVPSWWVWLVLVVAAVAAGWKVTTYPAFPWERHWQWLALGMSLPVVWLVGHLLWLISSRRRATFDPVFLGLVGTVWILLLIWAREVQTRHDQVVADQVASARDRLVGVDPGLRASQLERQLRATAQDRFRRYEAALSREDLRALQKLDGELLGGIIRAHESLERAAEATIGQSPEVWLEVQTRSELKAIREAYNRVYETMRALVDQLSTFKDRYEKGIGELDLDEGAQRIALAELERILQDPEFTLVTRIRYTEAEGFELIMRAISILEAEWGRWHFNKLQGQLLFEDKRAEEAFLHALFEVEEMFIQVHLLLEEGSR